MDIIFHHFIIIITARVKPRDAANSLYRDLFVFLEKKIKRSRTEEHWTEVQLMLFMRLQHFKRLKLFTISYFIVEVEY